MAVSNSNRGPCFWCIRIVKWMPVLFILVLLSWAYYAYVFQLCIVNVKSPLEQVIYLIFYHILYVMLCWSYWQTIFTEIGRVPNKYKLEEDQHNQLGACGPGDAQYQILEDFSKSLDCNNISPQGSIRYCDKCHVIKPDRAHHCSVCGECVLKMDHHCPWINNCVSFTNYKFFMLFLGYGLAYCIYVALTSLPYFISFWKGDLKESGRFHILFLFFIAVMFGISLVSLFCYHCYLVSENRTTLEAFHPPVFKNGPDKRGYNIGCCPNFQEVFGDDVKTWFLPIATSKGDGIAFPVNSRHQKRYSSLDSVRSC